MAMEPSNTLRQEIIIQELRIEHTLTTLGRSSDNDIRISDRTASAQHAKIITYFNTSYVEDLNSTNGTLLNGKRIHKSILHDGDEIQIGNHLFVVSKPPPDFFKK